MSVTDKINQLKKERNAVILAHYYVDDEVQAIADYVGDSFYLSKIATMVKAETSIFYGRKCENSQSGKDCHYAGYGSGLSHGPYGRY